MGVLRSVHRYICQVLHCEQFYQGGDPLKNLEAEANALREEHNLVKHRGKNAAQNVLIHAMRIDKAVAGIRQLMLAEDEENAKHPDRHDVSSKEQRGVST